MGNFGQFWAVLGSFGQFWAGLARNLRYTVVPESPPCLLQMQVVVGSNRKEGKICFSHFTLLKWNVKMFCKTNKHLKLTIKIIVKLSILI